MSGPTRLVILAPGGDDDLAAVPQRLEHDLRRLPVPHPSAPVALEVTGREGASIPDRVAHLLGECGVSAEHVAAPGMVLPHRRAEERPILDREEARLVRPVLENTPARKQARHRLARVRADARAEDDPMASLDRGDRVELDAGERADRLLDLPRAPSP